MKENDAPNSKPEFEWKSGRPGNFTKLFTVVRDREHWLVEEVGKDEEGHCILYSSQDYVMGASIATSENHAILTREQYLRQLDKALANNLITREQHEQFKGL